MQVQFETFVEEMCRNTLRTLLDDPECSSVCFETFRFLWLAKCSVCTAINVQYATQLRIYCHVLPLGGAIVK